ncbi:hypothetical protein KUCAC02_026186, partial [Chaenocephalus aceratus]
MSGCVESCLFNVGTVTCRKRVVQTEERNTERHTSFLLLRPTQAKCCLQLHLRKVTPNTSRQDAATTAESLGTERQVQSVIDVVPVTKRGSQHKETLLELTEEIQKFMEEVKSLGYQDKPQYEKLRSILQAGLKSIRAKDDGTLTFPAVSGAVSPAAKKTTRTKRKKAAAEEEEEEDEADGQPIKKKRVAKKK